MYRFTLAATFDRMLKQAKEEDKRFVVRVLIGNEYLCREVLKLHTDYVVMQDVIETGGGGNWRTDITKRPYLTPWKWIKDCMLTDIELAEQCGILD